MFPSGKVTKEYILRRYINDTNILLYMTEHQQDKKDFKKKERKKEKEKFTLGPKLHPQKPEVWP